MCIELIDCCLRKSPPRRSDFGIGDANMVPLGGYQLYARCTSMWTPVAAKKNENINYVKGNANDNSYFNPHR